MAMTILSVALSRPCVISLRATAIVVPPAVSVKMPSVSASRLMPSRISASLASSDQPPEPAMTPVAKYPSAGLPIARDLAMVFGLTGTKSRVPAFTAALIGLQPVGCARRNGFQLQKSGQAR
jgi:hypothetical protein